MPRRRRCPVVAVWSPTPHARPAVIVEEFYGGVRFTTHPDRVTPAQKEAAAAWWVAYTDGRCDHESTWQAMWGR